MNARRHLSYDELLLVYKYISLNYSIKKICELTNINRSTLYRLIINNSKIVEGYGSKTFSTRFRNCKYLITCKNNGLIACPNGCNKYKKYLCPNLERFPYMCNFCENKGTCKKEKRIFNPDYALKLRTDRNRESKTFPKIKQSELKRFDSWFSPFVKQGLSVENVLEQKIDNCPVTSRTVRNWIDKNYLSVKRHELRKAVTHPYKKEYSYHRLSKNPLIKVNRTFSSYLSYLSTHSLNEVTQFDTVHGLISDKKCILTIHHPQTKFQFGILLGSCSPTSVIAAMKRIKNILGSSLYLKFFRIMLCDNGVEFDDMYKLEIDEETGEIYGKVFYTRPYNSGDKGSCERNHEFFRIFIPKKKSLDSFTQEEIDEIFSQINSYPRKSLGYQTPYCLISKIMGSEFASKLNIREIPFKDLYLKN